MRRSAVSWLADLRPKNDDLTDRLEAELPRVGGDERTGESLLPAAGGRPAQSFVVAADDVVARVTPIAYRSSSS
jgi:hypothetical protein